jgi:peptidoglycan-associated lipoprotein
MKQGTLALLGLAMLLSTAACHKKTPVAAKPADTTPVASTPAPVAQQPLQQRPMPAAVRDTPQTQAPAAQMTPQERVRLNEILARLNDALFDYDKATIRDDASTVLKADVGVIRDILANYPSQKLLIEGNADERGSEEYNLALGDARAKQAKEYLATLGLPENQLQLISYGKDRPVCNDQDEACWQKNRRAHLTQAQ